MRQLILPPDEIGPDSIRWHQERRKGVTASEIPIVLGLSPWQSAFSLYWQKIEGTRVEETPAMLAGRLAEPAIVTWFEQQYPHLLPVPAGLYAQEDRPWQLATPDRLLYHGDTLAALLECKYLINSFDGWGVAGSDDIPVQYRAQVLWQLDVLDLDLVYVAAWHGAEFRTYQVHRDEQDLRVMREAGRRFWQRLQDQDPPPVDDHPATLDTLRVLHPKLADRDQEVTAATVNGYTRATTLTRNAERLRRLFESRLRDEMGDARRATHQGVPVMTRVVTDIPPSTVERKGYTRDYLLQPRARKGGA